MRPLSELLEQKDPAWPQVKEWVRAAKRPVRVLRPSDPQRSDCLHRLQVTTRSPMGAIVYETGGLLIDHGWLRILGSGHRDLPRSIPDWNLGRTWSGVGQPPALLVGDDVLGGFFALNGGALNGKLGDLNYFAPDSQRWHLLKMGYSEFVCWALSGDVETFYQSFRWPGWEAEVERVKGDQALSVYPMLFCEGPPIADRHRGPVPIAEIYTAEGPGVLSSARRR